MIIPHKTAVKIIILVLLALQNPLQMEGFMGKLTINGGFSIAMFDYQRVLTAIHMQVDR
jgi:hypothetical protein